VVVSLANILLRQAEKTGNTRAYLDDLITAKFTDVSAQGGNIIGTTVNGKSVQLQIQAGASARDIMVAAELALSCLERGLTRVPRQTYGLLRG
jgi:ribosome-associated translation inhibitor RaiA